MKTRIDEVSRKNLVGKSKVQSPTRYNKRLRYSTMSTPEIDGDKLLKDDMLVIYVSVGNYVVTLAYEGVIEHLIDVIKKSNTRTLNRKNVVRAMNEQVDLTDVYVRCTCLHPETKIKLLSGEILTVEEMEAKYQQGEQMWVYSVDDLGDFKPGKVEKVWQTGISKNFIEVTLDNGETIKTTPDHLYMLRNGSYCSASELSVGDSLMPLYFQNDERVTNGYERVKMNSSQLSYKAVYKLVAENILSDEFEKARIRSGEKHVAIHHKDYNKNNNSPENLEIMGREEHYKFHAKFVSDRWKNDPEFRRKATEASRKTACRINANPTPKMLETRIENLKKGWVHNYTQTSEEKDKQREVCRRAITKWWNDMTPEQYEDVCKRYKDVASRPEVKAKQSSARKQYWKNLSPEELKRRSEALKGDKNPACREDVKLKRYFYALDYISSNNLEMSEENYYRYKRHSDPRIETHFDNFEDLVKYYKKSRYNHKVVKIRCIEQKETPVYDIKVADYHNFYVDAGVILHNCPDWLYRYSWVASQHDYIYGPKQTIPADITNPNDDIGATCKHLLCVLANKRWLVKAAAVVNDYIHDNYEAFLDEYDLTEDDLYYDEQAYQKAIKGAVKQEKEKLPVELDNLLRKTFDPEEIELELFNLLDPKGYVVNVDYDLDIPVGVTTSKDMNAFTHPERAKHPLYSFDIISAGSNVKLVRSNLEE